MSGRLQPLKPYAGQLVEGIAELGLALPDETVDRLLQKAGTKNILVDLHAEMTSEKKAMGYYLDGRVSAVIGTHTHVQTADERVLPKGTAYITDAGMCGGKNSNKVSPPPL